MAIALTSPITGSAQTGLTSPTYTIVTDIAPDNNGKQFAITALGGTQTGVIPHTVASPFTVTFVRPKQLKSLSRVNPVTGELRGVPRNVYKIITRKGVVPLAGQPSTTMNIVTTIDVPAGSDTYDSNSVRAALSAHFGSLSQVSAGIGDTAVSAII